MKNPGGLTLKARNKGRNMTGRWVKLTTERGFSSLDHGACTLTYRYAKPGLSSRYSEGHALAKV